MSGLLNSLKNLATGGTGGKTGEDTNMRFSMSPSPGDSGYSQWLDAMKMVARLPGGIPPEFRKRLWITLAERHLQNKAVNWEQAERACFNEWSNPDDNELGVQIVKDLHRTGCSLFCGSAGQENQALLKRVLLAYARWNKAVGYCQGFNMLAALILQVMDRSETDAVKVMIYLIEGVLPESYFANNLRGLSVDMAVFRDLLRLRLPNLSRHLEALQNEAHEGTSYEPPLTNVFTMQWFLTLFCNCLPQATVLRVWDLIFLEGNEILLRTALAIWDGLADRILAVNSADEFYSIMGVLTREMLEFGFMDANTLIKSVVTIQVCNELPDLRDKYLYNITPWTQTVQSAAKKGFRLFYSDDDDIESDNDEKMAVTTAYGITLKKRRDSERRQSATSTIQPYAYGHPDREKLALDISALKQQYAKLRERQRQAHIILTAACTRQPMSHSPTSAPIAMNHLLLGKSAILSVRGRRLGPPQGAVPPSRNTKTKSVSHTKEGETLHWKDTAKRRMSRQLTQDVTECKDSNKIDSDGPEETHDIHSDSSSTYSEDDSSSTSTELCDEPGRGSDFDCEEPASLIDIPIDALSDSVTHEKLSDTLILENDASVRTIDVIESPNVCTEEVPPVESISVESLPVLLLESPPAKEEEAIVESPQEFLVQKPKFETSRSIEVLRENQNILDTYFSSLLNKPSRNDKPEEDISITSINLDENHTPIETTSTECSVPSQTESAIQPSLYTSISDLLIYPDSEIVTDGQCKSNSISLDTSMEKIDIIPSTNDVENEISQDPDIKLSPLDVQILPFESSICRSALESFESTSDAKKILVKPLNLESFIPNLCTLNSPDAKIITPIIASPKEIFNYRKFLKERGFDLSPADVMRIKNSPSDTFEKIVESISPEEFDLEKFLVQIAVTTLDESKETSPHTLSDIPSDLTIPETDLTLSDATPLEEKSSPKNDATSSCSTRRDSYDFEYFLEERIRCLKQNSIESMSSTKARIDSSEFNKTPSSDENSSRKFSISSFPETSEMQEEVFESSPERTTYDVSELSKDSTSVSETVFTGAPESQPAPKCPTTLEIMSQFEEIFRYSPERRNSETPGDVPEIISKNLQSFSYDSQRDIHELKARLSFDKQISLDSVPDDRLEHGRRNSELALKIIQENSMILHRILQCQAKSVDVVEEESKAKLDSPPKDTTCNDHIPEVENVEISPDDKEEDKECNSWENKYFNLVTVEPSIKMDAFPLKSSPEHSEGNSPIESLPKSSPSIENLDNKPSTSLISFKGAYTKSKVSPTLPSPSSSYNISPLPSPSESYSGTKPPSKSTKPYLSQLQFPPLSPSRKKTPSPLSPDTHTFNPFPSRPVTRQPKDVGLKLGLYKDISPLKSPK